MIAGIIHVIYYCFFICENLLYKRLISFVMSQVSIIVHLLSHFVNFICIASRKCMFRNRSPCPSFQLPFHLSVILRGKCVICNSAIFRFCSVIAYTLKICTSYFGQIWNIFFFFFFVWNSAIFVCRGHQVYVICNCNNFLSTLFKPCIVIANTFTMCTSYFGQLWTIRPFLKNLFEEIFVFLSNITFNFICINKYWVFFQPTQVNNSTLLFLNIPGAVIDAVICWWISF